MKFSVESQRSKMSPPDFAARANKILTVAPFRDSQQKISAGATVHFPWSCLSPWATDNITSITSRWLEKVSQRSFL